MAKQEITCEDMLKAKHYAPIYYLMGEEPYYIDVIADYIAEHVLSETEKEFNQTIVYGADVDIATIINAAKRYPMMSEHKRGTGTPRIRRTFVLPPEASAIHHPSVLPQAWRIRPA